MPRDHFELALSQCFAGRNFVPGRCAGRMWQWNQVELTACMENAEFAADYAFQFNAVDKLRDRQSTDGNDKARLQNSDLVIHPQRTVANLIRCWDAVTATGIFSGETTADRSEVNF